MKFKKCVILLFFSAVLLIPLARAQRYIVNISPEYARDIENADVRQALAAEFRDRAGHLDDVSPFVVSFKSTYDPTPITMSVGVMNDPRNEEEGRDEHVFDLLPVLRREFNRARGAVNPPAFLTLRGIYFPAAHPRGFLLGVHGIQSNGRWYMRTGQALALQGISSLFFDRRGSGVSDAIIDARGNPMPGQIAGSVFDQVGGLIYSRTLGDSSEFMEDMTSAFSALRTLRQLQNSSAPIHLYANCFGARVAFAYLGQTLDPSHDFASIITTSPGTNMKKGEFKGIKNRFDIAGPIDHYRKIQLVDSDFTSNPVALREMGNLALSRKLTAVTTRYLQASNAITKDMDAAIASAKLQKFPTLVFIPARDKIIYPTQTAQTFSGPQRANTVVAWLNTEHMIEFDDRAQPDLVTLMTGWMAGFSPGEQPGYANPRSFKSSPQVRSLSFDGRR